MTASTDGAADPMAESADEDVPLALQDAAYREAVVDLLGALAYGELSAFARLVEAGTLAAGSIAAAARSRWRSTCCCS